MKWKEWRMNRIWSVWRLYEDLLEITGAKNTNTSVRGAGISYETSLQVWCVTSQIPDEQFIAWSAAGDGSRLLGGPQTADGLPLEFHPDAVPSL
jgi:hypothetical protein